MSLTENPVSTVLDSESLTVPEEETWKVTLSADDNSVIEINGVTLKTNEDPATQIETVLTQDDTVEGTMHIGGFAL